jgi:hypothetical protein
LIVICHLLIRWLDEIGSGEDCGIVMTRILRMDLFYSDRGLLITLPFDVSSTVQLTVHVFGKKLRATHCFHMLLCQFFFFDVNSVANYSFMTDGWSRSIDSRDNRYSFPRRIDMNSFSSYQNGVVWVLAGFMDMGLTQTRFVISFCLSVFYYKHCFGEHWESKAQNDIVWNLLLRTFWSYFIIFRALRRNLSNLFPLHVTRLSTRRFWFPLYLLRHWETF